MKEFYWEKNSTLPTSDFYAANGIFKQTDYGSSNVPPRKLVRLVEQTGLTIFTSLTGWRRSELGFPLSAVHHCPNHDILDEHAFPVRCHVHWFVFKTSGKVLESREITFQLAILAERLDKLVDARPSQPCLFKTTSREKIVDSSVPVTMAVKGPWTHFVQNYTEFRTIDDLYSWKLLQTLDPSELELSGQYHHEMQRLLLLRSESEWNDLMIDSNLKEAHFRLRKELPMVEFFNQHPATGEKRGWLEGYQNRTLSAEWLEMLDSNLSKETREWIDGLVAEDFKINWISRIVTDELMANCVYPIPHAFRHMFAEAVYRRFDGDVGWMIRSQFKHISKTMWLAYIRDKDNRGDHRLAKLQVVSSLVRNFIGHAGLGYAGPMSTWLRRLTRSTTVVGADEQAEFVRRISATEIIDVKASPWGYCLLKARTRRNANCAEAGEPQRHLAAPNVCLGCTHNFMQTENVDWILVHLISQVDAIQNPAVPHVFKAEAYKLIKSATKQIRTLNPNHESLPELQGILESHAA